MFTCGATGVAYCSHVVILWWLGKGEKEKKREGREEEKGRVGETTRCVESNWPNLPRLPLGFPGLNSRWGEENNKSLQA